MDSTPGLLCPLSLGVCSNSCPLSQWCYLTVLSPDVPFSFGLQSFLPLTFKCRSPSAFTSRFTSFLTPHCLLSGVSTDPVASTHSCRTVIPKYSSAVQVCLLSSRTMPHKHLYLNTDMFPSSLVPKVNSVILPLPCPISLSSPVFHSKVNSTTIHPYAYAKACRHHP